MNLPLSFARLLAWLLPVLLLQGVLPLAAQPAGLLYGDPAEGLPAAAKEAGRPYVVELQADWCGFCRLFERQTLADTAVRRFLQEHFLIASVDGEEGFGAELYRRYKARGYPTLLFFASDGKLLGKAVGYQDAEYFLYSLRRYKAKSDKMRPK
jgi:thiol:disulfide interchange protein